MKVTRKQQEALNNALRIKVQMENTADQLRSTVTPKDGGYDEVSVRLTLVQARVLYATAYHHWVSTIISVLGTRAKILYDPDNSEEATVEAEDGTQISVTATEE